MIKIDIISGFLGAGKTTLIKKLLKEAYGNEKIVLIENEFGEIGVDGDFLHEAGVEIKEMNSGCICCSLVGDFEASLEAVIIEYQPDRIIIEPSGVGKLSDVIKAVENVHNEKLQIQGVVTVVDATKCKLYMKNFGEFFINQVKYAKTIVVSRAQMMDTDKLETCVKLLQEHNAQANLITTSWDLLQGKQIAEVMQHSHTLEKELKDEMKTCCQHHEHHEHNHTHETCGCGHHDHTHEACGCGNHNHTHETCGCGHHNHHANDIFDSWGKESVQIYSEAKLRECLQVLITDQSFKTVLRAKGMVESNEQTWLYFDVVPGEFEIRPGLPISIGKVCVIGTNLQKDKLNDLFTVRKEV